MEDEIPNGTFREVDGRRQIFYEGFWLKAYDPPADTLLAKKTLIEALTRRLFNHVEHGINIPGRRLAEVRASFEAERDPDRRRVKGAMLAGALFNRATDIFTKLVELQQAGVEIDSSSPLMRECGGCLQEALSLGKLVLHRSGEEGIDELWGEPFRAFCYPIDAFYEGRYLKIAQVMKDINRICGAIVANLGSLPYFAGIEPLLEEFAAAAREKVETLRTDERIVDVWASFVVSSEHLANHLPLLPHNASESLVHAVADGHALICKGRDLVFHIVRARTPMPKSTLEYIERMEAYHARMVAMAAPVSQPRAA